MKRIVLAAIVFLSGIIAVSAQSNLREGRVLVRSSPVKTQRGVKDNDISNNDRPKIVSDTVYCTYTKKQHGWFAPLDTVTKEVAMHLGVYYRFSNKNMAGHWCKLECLDSYGRYVTGTFSPYILKLGNAAESDRNANEEWIEKLKTACIYEFIADYSGENIIQERAYDEKMNIIYTFSRVPIGNQQFICSYKDFYGLPAEMRKNDDENNTYGTLVKLTEDKWGNDSTIVFIDAKGKPKLNSDGVAMEKYVHDKYGRYVKQQSCNSDGSLTIDNWGNCGIEYTWNSSNQIVSATYMDDEWHPMKMPAIRGNEQRENIITVNYTYDEFSRIIEEYYTDNHGNPDVNVLGTHRIVYEYNDKGDRIKVVGYDLHGNLSPIGNSMDVIEKYEFNTSGKFVSAVFLDKDNKPNSTEGYLCSIVCDYDENGNKVLDERYHCRGGVVKLSSKHEIRPEYEYTLWSDGSSRLDSLDNRGRVISIHFYDSSGHPEIVYGRASEYHSYIDDPIDHIEIDTERNYDDLGYKINIDGIHKTVSKKDSTDFTVTKWRYDTNDELVEVFIHQYDEGFKRILSQDDANIWGKKARCGGSSSVRYYTGAIVYSQKGKFASLVGKDEFGEPDYITSNSLTYYYSKIYSKSKTKFFDENNKEIEDIEELRDALPKVMTIEVIDSTAYKSGLRDNDIILVYGDYCVNLDEVHSFYDFRSEWSLASILNARKNNRMVVFRVEEATSNKYGLVEINNLTGTPSEQGYLPHIRYLTKRQTERIKTVIEENINSSYPLVTKEDLKPRVGANDKFVILAFTDMFRSVRNRPYPKQVTDPSILLGACIKDRNMYWDISNSTDTEAFEEMVSSRKDGAVAYPTMHFYVTKNMNDITHIVLDGKGLNTKWFTTKISNDDYNALLKLGNTTKRNLKAINESTPCISSKQLIAHWRTDNAQERFSPIADFNFEKKGHCSGSLKRYGKIVFNEGTAIFEITSTFDGTWSSGDKMITIKPSSENSNVIHCIDLLGADDDLRQRALDFVNGACDKDPSFYLEHMEMLNKLNMDEGELFVRSINDKEMIVEDGSEHGIRLIKISDSKKKRKEKDSREIKKKLKDTIYNSEILPYVGVWQASVDFDVDDAKFIMTICEDSQITWTLTASSSEDYDEDNKVYMTMVFKLNAKGIIDSNELKAIEPAVTDVDVDVVVKDKEGKENALLAKMISAMIKTEKDKMVMGFLKETPFDEAELIFKKEGENVLEMNGYTFRRM